MKTNTNRKQETVPREVQRFEHARVRALDAMERASRLRSSPAVKSYFDEREGKAEPTEQQKKEKELSDLYTLVFARYDALSDYFLVLGELAHAESDVNVQHLQSMFIDMDNKLWAMHGDMARVFELCGIVREETAHALEMRKQEED